MRNARQQSSASIQCAVLVIWVAQAASGGAEVIHEAKGLVAGAQSLDELHVAGQTHVVEMGVGLGDGIGDRLSGATKEGSGIQGNPFASEDASSSQLLVDVAHAVGIDLNMVARWIDLVAIDLNDVVLFDAFEVGIEHDDSHGHIGFQALNDPALHVCNDNRVGGLNLDLNAVGVAVEATLNPRDQVRGVGHLALFEFEGDLSADGDFGGHGLCDFVVHDHVLPQESAGIKGG